jgi:hypothetical protein
MIGMSFRWFTASREITSHAFELPHVLRGDQLVLRRLEKILTVYW